MDYTLTVLQLMSSKKTINFLVSGMLGDFIHSMGVVKNLCALHGKTANVYLTDGHHGDIWRFGVDKAYEDLKELVMAQPYMGDFSILENGQNIDGFINLNLWRISVATTHAETGKYDTCWGELLSSTYGYPINEYQWLQVDTKPTDFVVIHRSLRHHNSNIFWERMFNRYKNKKIVFLTCDPNEYENFFLRNRCKLLLATDILDMAQKIASSKLFIGNQSSPFAMACALDVPRICELYSDAAPFYIGEEKYSQNHQWWLNDKTQNCSRFQKI